MIECTVCQENNSEKYLVCKKCGAYLRDRIPNVDFFKTATLIVESPKKGFENIILAEHKNFNILLMIIFGLVLSFTLMISNQVGDKFSNLLILIFSGMFSGLLIAILVLPATAILSIFIARIVTLKVDFKNILSVICWSFLPFLLLLTIIVPTEWILFGLDLYDSLEVVMENFKYIFYLIIGLHLITFIWSFVLLIIGFKNLLTINFQKSFLLAVANYTFIYFITNKLINL